MIRIAAVLSAEGLLQRLRVEGHAGQGREQGDPACAGVSVLTRTAARVVAGREGFEVDGGGEEGFLSFTVRWGEGADKSWMRGVTDSLLWGVSDLAEEYPLAVSAVIEREGKKDGT